MWWCKLAAPPEGGDHDVAVLEAVGGVGGAHPQGMHLPGLDDLESSDRDDDDDDDDLDSSDDNDDGDDLDRK